MQRTTGVVKTISPMEEKRITSTFIAATYKKGLNFAIEFSDLYILYGAKLNSHHIRSSLTSSALRAAADRIVATLDSNAMIPADRTPLIEAARAAVAE